MKTPGRLILAVTLVSLSMGSGCALVFRAGGDPGGKTTLSQISGPPAGLVFTKTPFSARPTVCSNPIQIRLVDSVGLSATATALTTVTLSGMAPGSFYDSNDPTCGGLSITSTAISAGQSSVNVYYRAATSQTVTLGAASSGLGSGSLIFTVASAMGFSTPVATTSSGNGARTVVSGDFDGDGKQDLVVGNEYDATLSFYKGNGDATVSAPVTVATLGSSPMAPLLFEVVGADLNGDGKKDLMVSDYQNRKIQVYLGNGDGTFTAGYLSPFLGAEIETFQVGDVNLDGRSDIVLGTMSGNEYRVLLGVGDGTFNPLASVAIGGCTTAIDVTIGLFNADVNPDLAVACGSSHEIRIFLGNGDGTFSAGSVIATNTPIASPSPWRIVAVPSLDAGGTVDLIASYWAGGAPGIAVLYGDGTGGFAAPSYIATGQTSHRVIAADFDGDGDLDVAVPENGSNRIGVLTNSAGTLGSLVHYSSGATTNPRGIVAVDLDADGELDLVTPNLTSNSITILHGVP